MPAVLSVPLLLATMAYAQMQMTQAPAPFWPAKGSSLSGPEASVELGALRALNLGLASIAIERYQALLDDPQLTEETRNRVALSLATAYLEEDRFADAGRVLQTITGPATPQVRLRQALVYTRERRFDAAREIAQALTPESLPPADRGWLFFMRGQLAEAARDFQQAGNWYQQADDAATAAGLEAQRAWFFLARQRMRLLAGNVTESQVDALRNTVDKNAGSAQGYQATSQLAIALNQLGQRTEAIRVLQEELRKLSPQERLINDEWQLLLGLIAGAEEGAGRNALRGLLLNSTDQDRQRIAVRLLARASRTGARRTEFRNLLDQLIAAPSPHPILEYLLLFRAQSALADPGDKQYTQAEDDANRLLKEFPNSPLKAAALGLLTDADWERGYYRKAATNAARARAELEPGQTRAQLGVLLAEAYFRAAAAGNSPADYRTAADAYGATLSEVPAGVPVGDLMFQRLLSAINAGQLDFAEDILDDLTRDPRLEPAYRWQMEWNLARALQAAGRASDAYARVNQLLDNPLNAVGLPPDLRVSMAWLQTRLAYENDEPTRALALAESLVNSLDGAADGLRAEVASNALLLQAQAGFALKTPERTAAAQASLAQLRTDYPNSSATVFSYIIEAEAAAAEGKVVDAQRFVIDLADRFPDSEYAPYALYSAASYAERRGSDRQYYEEANRILERLVSKYPDHPIVFYARLKQGNLLRLMNEYGRASTLYHALVNSYPFPRFADGLSAQIALADTEKSLSASDPARASNAAAIYELLYDMQAAPVDLRVEAGHKLGLYREDSETPKRAYDIWWPMIEAWVLDDAKAAKLGANGRYWMARTMVKLAELQERQNKPQEARRLYELILEKNIPATAHAREGLARTGGRPRPEPASP